MRRLLARTRLNMGMPLNPELLEKLLRERESPSLEFKRAWYGIEDPAAKRQQRDELVKDVLSLVNGSPDSVGKPAYLVIGADDVLDPRGQRQLHDVGDLDAEGLRRTIIQLVSSASEPALQDLLFDLVELEGFRLAVVTVPPSPHLHETTRDVSSFSERAVFVRRGESIRVASAGERDAISRLKRIHFRETRNAPPVRFGLAVGGLTGGLVLLTQAVRAGDSPAEKLAQFAVGVVLFGALGAVVGFAYRQYVDVLQRRELLPTSLRVVLGVILLAAALWFVISIANMILG